MSFTDSTRAAIIGEDLQISGLSSKQQAFAQDLVTKHGFQSFTEATEVLEFVRGGSEPTAESVFQQLVNANNVERNQARHATRAANLESVQMSVQASRMQQRTDKQLRILGVAIEAMESVDVDTFFANEPELKMEFTAMVRAAKVLPMKAKNRHDWTMGLTPILDACSMFGLDLSEMTSEDKMADEKAIALADPNSSDDFGG